MLMDVLWWHGAWDDAMDQRAHACALAGLVAGHHRAGAAGCPAIAGVSKALVLVVGRIVVADVSRPVFHEAQRQAGIPIGVIRSYLFIRLESNSAAYARREETKQLPCEGVANIALDGI